eukprot:scaffold10249_cov36-Attheya_sp.AAC.1
MISNVPNHFRSVDLEIFSSKYGLLSLWGFSRFKPTDKILEDINYGPDHWDGGAAITLSTDDDSLSMNQRKVKSNQAYRRTTTPPPSKNISSSREGTIVQEYWSIADSLAPPEAFPHDAGYRSLG